EGIFTGPDPLADKVIATGDLLFGSALVEIVGLYGLNNNGQIAFYGTLADGRQVVVRADPAGGGIPPPPALGPVAAGGLGLLGWVGWQRRRRGPRVRGPGAARPGRPTCSGGAWWHRRRA